MTRSMTRPVLGALFALALAACGTRPAMPRATLILRPADAGVTLVARAALGQHGSRHLLGPVANKTIANVAELRVKLYQAETLITSATLDAENLSAAVTFENLKSFTTYVVKAEAYEDNGEGLDLISTQDARSEVEVAVTNEPNLTISVPCQLIDVGFAATADAPSIVVSPGGYASPAAAEAIVVATPSPTPTPAP